MLSLITPTMWQFEPFCDNLKYILQLDVVDEIIIINNLVEETPDHPILKNPKVRLLNQEKNIYVNPAWNLGAALAKHDKLLFFSDDVIIDLKAFFMLDEFLSEDVGMVGVGVSHDIYYIQSEEHKELRGRSIEAGKHLVTGLVEINPGQFGVGYGTFFGVHRKNWIDIPPELLVHFGDIWVIKAMEYINKQNYSMMDCFYYSPWSVTAANWKHNPRVHMPQDKIIIENPEYVNARLENFFNGTPIPEKYRSHLEKMGYGALTGYRAPEPLSPEPPSPLLL